MKHLNKFNENIDGHFPPSIDQIKKAASDLIEKASMIGEMMNIESDDDPWAKEVDDIMKSCEKLKRLIRVPSGRFGPMG